MVGWRRKPVIPAPRLDPEPDPVKKPPKKAKWFYLFTKLDYTRINKSVREIVEEILSNIHETNGSELRIHIEATARCENGFPDDTSTWWRRTAMR